ncbi:hypothetical protein HanRHA438_Chr17g0792781 [Helianthus annuus]|nr:hypothetical protein HanRHA438_Chr17g0792781 [Helianthus annuus]
MEVFVLVGWCLYILSAVNLLNTWEIMFGYTKFDSKILTIHKLGYGYRYFIKDTIYRLFYFIFVKCLARVISCEREPLK